MNSRDATKAGVQVLANSIAQDADNMSTGFNQFKRIPEAYDLAPAYGRLQGAMYGIPAGLLAGGAVYGLSSLLPWIRRKKRLKQILSLAAATAGGVAVSKPVYEKSRDAYFEWQTGVSSPWKNYVIGKDKTVTVNPSAIIESYRDAFAKAKDDPLGYFRQQMANDIHASKSKNSRDLSAIADAYSEAWQRFRKDPMGYMKNNFDNPQK